MEATVDNSFVPHLSVKAGEEFCKQKQSWNILAISYIFLAYYGGISFLLHSNIVLNVLGVGFVTHSLVLSHYLVHEFMHETIFEKHKFNEFFGSLMLWLNGGCYSKFRDLARWHFAHHLIRGEYSSFDIPSFLHKLPSLPRMVITNLEGCYFPFFAFLLQWRTLTGPFWDPKRFKERPRTIVLLSIRVLMFFLLGLASIKALLLYFFSYIGMHVVTQYIGAYLHTYESYRIGIKIPKRDWKYDNANTFTCLLSRRFKFFNLLILNFGYHNAHHALMKCPWHSLPELHEKLLTNEFKQDYGKVHSISLPAMIQFYHRFRTDRLKLGCGKALDESGKFTPETFYGNLGFSDIILPV